MCKFASTFPSMGTTGIKYDVTAVIVTLIWGGTFINTRLLIDNGVAAHEIYFLRAGIAYTALWLFCMASGRGMRVRSKTLRDEATFLLLGVTGGSLYFMTENAAIGMTVVTNVSFIVSSCPFFATLIAILFTKSLKANKNIMAGGLTAIAGLALVVFNGKFILKLSPQGDTLAMAACLSWAVYSVVMRSVTERYDAVMALRGDPPRFGNYDPSRDAFHHASELVRFIRRWEDRQHLDRRLTIGVAGFPEGHPESRNRIREMDFLKAKLDEGADYICTQLFFDNHNFFDYRDRCRLLGINAPIIAGIMPVISISGMNRMADLSSGTNFPARLLKGMLRAGGDRESIERIGINYASYQCSELLDAEVDGIHFYTLNKSKATLSIYKNLGINNYFDVDRIHMMNDIYKNSGNTYDS